MSSVSAFNGDILLLLCIFSVFQSSDVASIISVDDRSTPVSIAALNV